MNDIQIRFIPTFYTLYTIHKLLQHASGNIRNLYMVLCVCVITLICILRDTYKKMQMPYVILSRGHIGAIPATVNNTSRGVARNSSYVQDGHYRIKKNITCCSCLIFGVQSVFCVLSFLTGEMKMCSA